MRNQSFPQGGTRHILDLVLELLEQPECGTQMTGKIGVVIRSRAVFARKVPDRDARAGNMLPPGLQRLLQAHGFPGPLEPAQHASLLASVRNLRDDDARRRPTAPRDEPTTAAGDTWVTDQIQRIRLQGYVDHHNRLPPWYSGAQTLSDVQGDIAKARAGGEEDTVDTTALEVNPPVCVCASSSNPRPMCVTTPSQTPSHHRLVEMVLAVLADCQEKAPAALAAHLEILIRSRANANNIRWGEGGMGMGPPRKTEDHPITEDQPIHPLVQTVLQQISELRASLSVIRPPSGLGIGS